MNPLNSTIYTIGHGQKTAEEFIAELKAFDIQFLADVRTTPFSKWVHHFNKGVIEDILKSVGIRYLFMGNCIGGRPQNDTCYDNEGFFDYKLMAEEPKFKVGLSRLVDANSQHFRVAVMCSETDPSECHRSKLIGRELYFNYNLDINHIVSIGKTISQSEVMTALTKGVWLPTGDLFGQCEPPYFKSRKVYNNIVNIEELNPIDLYD